MTYFINQNDIKELTKIADLVNEAENLNQQLKHDINIKIIQSDYHYHDPRENLWICIERLIYTLNINFGLKISSSGIQSFSKNELETYNETLTKLDLILNDLRAKS